MRSNVWLERNKKDIYVKKAKKDGYFSRSSYKLLEIEKKFKFISKSKNILELGSSPGGWSQVICKINSNNKKLLKLPGSFYKKAKKKKRARPKKKEGFRPKYVYRIHGKCDTTEINRGEA